MPLTDDESRRLRAIESQLRHTDRRLDRTLSTGRSGFAHERVAVVAAGLLAVPLLVIGEALHAPALCMVGWLLIVAWVVLLCIDGW